MKDFNPAFTLGAGPDRSLNQPENNLLDEEGKRRYQSIVGAAMYLEHHFPPPERTGYTGQRVTNTWFHLLPVQKYFSDF